MYCRGLNFTDEWQEDSHPVGHSKHSNIYETKVDFLVLHEKVVELKLPLNSTLKDNGGSARGTVLCIFQAIL